MLAMSACASGWLEAWTALLWALLLLCFAVGSQAVPARPGTCRPPPGGDESLHLVVSRQAADSLEWLPLIGSTPYTLFTEPVAGRHGRRGMNHSRWREKPLTRAGGTTRECGGYLSFIIANYDDLPRVTVFIHGQQSLHFTHAHPHSDPNIFYSIRNMRAAPEKVEHCSLNFYYTDWREVPWYASGWQRELALAGRSRFGELWRVFLPLLPDGGTRCFCCAQFAVSREQLRSHPLVFYTQLLAFIQEDGGFNPWDDRLHVSSDASKNGRCDLMEPTWHLLFGVPAVCPRDRTSCRAVHMGGHTKDFVVDRHG